MEIKDTMQEIKELVELGRELERLKPRYFYKDIMKFLKGESESCHYFGELKPLYDKYGYALVNTLLLDDYKGEEESND